MALLYPHYPVQKSIHPTVPGSDFRLSTAGARAHVPGLHLAREDSQLARRGDRVLDTRPSQRSRIESISYMYILYIYIYLCVCDYMYIISYHIISYHIISYHIISVYLCRYMYICICECVCACLSRYLHCYSYCLKKRILFIYLCV